MAEPAWILKLRVVANMRCVHPNRVQQLAIGGAAGFRRSRHLDWMKEHQKMPWAMPSISASKSRAPLSKVASNRHASADQQVAQKHAKTGARQVVASCAE